MGADGGSREKLYEGIGSIKEYGRKNICLSVGGGIGTLVLAISSALVYGQPGVRTVPDWRSDRLVWGLPSQLKRKTNEN